MPSSALWCYFWDSADWTPAPPPSGNFWCGDSGMSGMTGGGNIEGLAADA